MNNSFKFRVNYAPGKFFFSDDPDFDLIFWNNKIFYIDSYGDKYEVNPDDVSILAAFDPNNNELYTNDIIFPNFFPDNLLSYPAKPFSVHLEPVLRDSSNHYFFLPKGFRSA